VRFDDLTREERRKLCRTILKKGPRATPDEQEKLHVLMLMVLGMTEEEARRDMRLREKQTRHLSR
jgi:hypothetical protein